MFNNEGNNLITDILITSSWVKKPLMKDAVDKRVNIMLTGRSVVTQGFAFGVIIYSVSCSQTQYHLSRKLVL